MNCLECQDLLQRRLDGNAIGASDALEQHLSQCAACREQHAALQRLFDGLKAMPKPQLAPDFAARMTSEVLRDRRQRQDKMRRRVVLTLALAASVVLMLMVAYYWFPRTPNETPSPKNDFVKQDPPKKETPEPKKDEVTPKKDEPRNALATLPDRMAETTRDHAKVVLAAANVDKLPMQQLPALDPGMGDSVRVVSRNTRRAFDYFARELPMPEFASKAE